MKKLIICFAGVLCLGGSLFADMPEQMHKRIADTIERVGVEKAVDAIAQHEEKCLEGNDPAHPACSHANTEDLTKLKGICDLLKKGAKIKVAMSVQNACDAMNK